MNTSCFIHDSGKQAETDVSGETKQAESTGEEDLNSADADQEGEGHH